MTVEIRIIGEDANVALADLESLSKALLPDRLAGRVDPVAVGAEPDVKSAAESATPEKPKRGRKPVKADDSKPNITAAPEDRANPEDDAQDAEDETAGEELGRPLTVDDVRNAAGAYIEKFGLEAAQLDLMGCLKAATGVEKISLLPADDQDVLGKAVAAFAAAAQADKRYGAK